MPTSTSTRASDRLSLHPVSAHGAVRHRRILSVGSPRAAAPSPAGPDGRRWLTRLRRALAKDLFVLHYQPIVALGDGRISHYEALLRLADEPAGKLVAPGRFLPAAERHGMIAEIDRMVLGKVAALLGERGGRGADAGGGLALAVNLSALSVTDGRMLGLLERLLHEHRVAPSRLVVEVTETAAISDMDSAKAFCAGVQELGCAVALDDFGAGFGSFQYLKHLPFSYLKIDGEFIRGLLGSRTDQLVVRALVDVVRGMGRETIAEFVGDARTLGMLRSYGVDYAQGFEVGRPQPDLPALA
jgi:EAL domain-containing protein (putative c-di-GMP-specific phosphodiesterase class I)